MERFEFELKINFHGVGGCWWLTSASTEVGVEVGAELGNKNFEAHFHGKLRSFEKCSKCQNASTHFYWFL